MWHSHPAVNRRAHITTKKLHDRKIFCCQQTPKAQDSFGCLYKDKSIPHHVSHAPWVGSSPNSTALHSPCHPPPQSFSFTQVLEIRISAYFTLLATLTARKLRYKSPKEKRKENDRQGIKRANKFSFIFMGCQFLQVLTLTEWSEYLTAWNYIIMPQPEHIQYAGSKRRAVSLCLSSVRRSKRFCSFLPHPTANKSVFI